MMDLLVTCDSTALIKVLCSGLGTQPDMPQAAGPKRTRKAASNKKGKAKASDDSVLDVRIVMLHPGHIHQSQVFRYLELHP
jgi:hypothetical protein